MIFSRPRVAPDVNFTRFWSQTTSYAGMVGIIITLALMPIDRLPYLHYIPFNLGLISLILLLIATADRLVRRLLASDYKVLRKYLIFGGLLALPVIGYAISTTWAIDHNVALHATKLLLAVALRAFCFMVLVAETPNLWRLVKRTIYIVSAIVVAYGFFQFFADVFGASGNLTDLRNCCTSNSTYVFPRVYSTAQEPLYLDHFLLIPLWLLMFDFLRYKTARSDKRRVVLFITTATLFITTIARSADIGIAVAAIIFYLALRHQTKLKSYWRYMFKAWGTAILIALVLVAMSGVVAIFIPKNALHGADSGVGSVGLFGSHEFDITDGSAQTRYTLWPKAVGYFEQKPLTGVGASNSRIKLNLSKYDHQAAFGSLQPFNNDFIALMVDLGLLAIVFFGPLVALLIRAFVKLYKSRWSGPTAAMALVLIAMFIQGNFFQSLLLTRVWVVIGLLLASLFMPAASRLKSVDEDSN